MKTAIVEQKNNSPSNITTISLGAFFKNLVLRFRLLHSVNEVLTKVSQPTDSLSSLEKLLLSKLGLLKNSLSLLSDDSSNTQVLEINAIIRYIERRLSEYHQNIVERSNLLSVVNLRQYIDSNKMQNSEIKVLTQFEFYLHSDNETNHQKLELLLTRLLCDVNKLEEIDNTVKTLFNSSIYNSNLDNIKIKPLDEPVVIDALVNINNQINNAENFDDLILKKSINRLRQIKGQLKNSFWNPTTLAYLIFTDVNVHNKFDHLLEIECKEIKEDAANLILHGVDYIPKINNDEQSINLIHIYKFACKINTLTKQEYKNNHYSLAKLIYVNKALKQAMQNSHNKTLQPLSNSLSSTNKNTHLTQKGWAIVDNNDEQNNILYNSTTSLHTKSKFNNYNRYIKSFEQNLDEEQLEDCIKHIIKTLHKRELNGRDQIIRLKYSDLILHKDEIALLLNFFASEITIAFPTVLVRRSIAIYAQLHDALSFYENKSSLLSASTGIYGLVNLTYYWSQGQDTVIAINNYITKLKQQNELDSLPGLISIMAKLKNILDKLPALYNLVYIN